MGPDLKSEEERASSLTYPSPGAEGIDSGPFYQSNAREGTSEHHDQADETEAAQGHHHDQHELSAHDHGSPQHHMSRPANLEELQLAAQLGEGLAAGPIMPATDPNMTVDDDNMRSMMPHAEGDQNHHHAASYGQDPQGADAITPHGMPIPVGHSQQQYHLNESIPPRKRSKVSRACDECRRKKIKCDATSDSGEAPCSSCARSSIRCLFSRIPQKRGPSKGYIKELADRINSIESKLESDGNLSHEDLEKLFATDRSRQSNVGSLDDQSRKRNFSSISGADVSSSAIGRPSGWPADTRNGQENADGLSGTSGNNSLAPQPSAIKSYDTPSKPRTEVADNEMGDMDELPEIDDSVFEEFLSTVQLVYPILPNNKTRLQALLAQASPAVRTAFTLALPCVGQPESGDVKIASSLLHEWEASRTVGTRATDIVHALTLLLLIIDADWRATSALPFLLARAVALAHSMKLWAFKPAEAAQDADSDDQLQVRMWWSLVLMDRWHAAGTGQPSQIPDSSAVFPAGLEATLGEVPFHLIRLSKLLNRISFVISTLRAGASTAEAPMAAILNDYIENYREDLPAHVDAAAYPLVHLAYWHCRLIVNLLTPGATPKEILWPTKELADLLSINGELQSPLANHFVSLATMSLIRLAKTEDEATELIKEITERPPGGQWDGVREKLAARLRLSSAAEAASQGLQHLADLATAYDGATAAGDELPFAAGLATGYLEVAST